MGSFAIGAGEKAGAYSVNFDDTAFHSVIVPGDTQLQAGFTGVKGFLETKDLVAINEKEWWYRKQFRVPSHARGSINRLVFDGSDYFTTVWLNGHCLGTHEGTYTPFSFDVTKFLHYGRKNLLAIKVTHPWIPEGRGLTEYMNGDFSFANHWSDMPLNKLPYFIDVNWDALPAGGNAAFAMGIWRSVHLVTSSPIFLSDLNVETESIGKDGSATLRVSATMDNETSHSYSRTIQLLLKPNNFQGSAITLSPLEVKAVPGKTIATEEVRIANAHLWWTWDRGPQNLYELQASIAPANGLWGDERSVRFGIRTITRDQSMAYHLNGQRLFIKGSWFPIDQYYRSTPTYWDYDRDLRLFRGANFNMLVNFTVVEKPAFYDLCDQLGILVVTELPFPQLGPQQVLDKDSPRKEPFLKQARLQVSEIVTELRNHPSIIEWAPLAEAHDKEGNYWGYGGVPMDQEGYNEFVDDIRTIIARLSPDTIYHPSLCDLGEQHFWMAGAGHSSNTENYQTHFDAKADFVSEYGSISMSSYEYLGKYLTSKQQWNPASPDALRWFNLPIDIPAYAYWTSNMNDGLYSMLFRAEHFIDRDPRSARELVNDTQMYQAFLMKYATEAYRRKKYDPIMGIRSWDFLELAPGFRFGIVDYDRVPKIAYWYLKKAQAPVAISFAFKFSLESQLAGSHWSVPVWVNNDLDQSLQGILHVEMRALDGKLISTHDFGTAVGADSKSMAGTFSLDLPSVPGVYMLRASLKSESLHEPVSDVSFVKVVAPAFSTPHHVLLIAQSRYAKPIEQMLQAMGVDVDVFDENSLDAMAKDLHDGAAIHAKYDVIWFGCFESLFKVLPSSTAQAIRQAVRLGSGFIYTGGDGSFHGGQGRAAMIEATALDALLPVSVEDHGDVILGRYSMDDSLEAHPVIHAIGAADAHAGTGISRSVDLLRHYGLPGFNQVAARPSAKIDMTIAGQPLLVVGSYGAGKVVAFTGFTPAAGANKTPALPLDQEFIGNPANRAYFVVFSTLLQQALPGDPLLAANLLAQHETPLFQTLNRLPQTQIAISEEDGSRVDGKHIHCRLHITSRGGYAHLVHLRVVWPGTQDHPYLTEFSDNDFELLPNETKDIDVDWWSKTPDVQPHGSFVANAENANEVQLAF
jgi:beta-mannosidase